MTIVSLGERIPADIGYRPGRYGRLAAHLTAQGHEVSRIVPSFRHDLRQQRQSTLSDSQEGRAFVVPTRQYVNNRGADRFGSLVDLIAGSARLVRKNRPKVAIVPSRPPGLTAAIKAASPSTQVIVDIRDLWPDALHPGSTGIGGKGLELIGRSLALEMYGARNAVGLSTMMLNRAPASKRRAVAVIGIDESTVDLTRPKPTEPELRLCFVGNIGPGLDFEPLMSAIESAEHPCRLDIFGRGPRAQAIATRVASLSRTDFHGPVTSDRVPHVLANYDVGVVPRVRGFGTCLSNKVFEYLAAGLFVAFRLEPGVGSELGALDLGSRYETTQQWKAGLHGLWERLDEVRQTRAERISLALDKYSSLRTNEVFAEIVTEIDRS